MFQTLSGGQWLVHALQTHGVQHVFCVPGESFLAVLDALVTAARRRGDTQVQLHAQASALNFYRRAGFEPQGEAFVEAGIAHQSMVMPL